MKVYIGPYEKWLSSRKLSDYMTKKYGYDWPPESKYTKYEKFLGVLDDVMDWFYSKTFNRIYSYSSRKIQIRIDDYDTFNADHTIALIVLPLLKKMKESKRGSSFVNNEDVPKELQITDKQKKAYDKDGSCDPNYFKRWDYVLDEMIFAFECVVDDDWEEEFYSGDYDISFVPIDNDGNVVAKEDATRFKLSKGPNDTNVFDKEGYMKTYNRIDNGLILFGKYFRALWT